MRLTMNKWIRNAVIVPCCLMALTAMAQGVVDTRPHVFDNNVRSLKVSLENNMPTLTTMNRVRPPMSITTITSSCFPIRTWNCW